MTLFACRFSTGNIENPSLVFALCEIPEPAACQVITLLLAMG